MNRTLGDREKAMVAAARLAAHYVDVLSVDQPRIVQMGVPVGG